MRRVDEPAQWPNAPLAAAFTLVIGALLALQNPGPTFQFAVDLISYVLKGFAAIKD